MNLLIMEGHALYVWAAYGICVLVMIWLVLAPMGAHRRLLKILQENTKINFKATDTPAKEEP